jgi:hypothetical protein
VGGAIKSGQLAFGDEDHRLHEVCTMAHPVAVNVPKLLGRRFYSITLLTADDGISARQCFMNSSP